MSYRLRWLSAVLLAPVLLAPTSAFAADPVTPNDGGCWGVPSPNGDPAPNLGGCWETVVVTAPTGPLTPPNPPSEDPNPPKPPDHDPSHGGGGPLPNPPPPPPASCTTTGDAQQLACKKRKAIVCWMATLAGGTLAPPGKARPIVAGAAGALCNMVYEEVCADYKNDPCNTQGVRLWFGWMDSRGDGTGGGARYGLETQFGTWPIL